MRRVFAFVCMIVVTASMCVRLSLCVGVGACEFLYLWAWFCVWVLVFMSTSVRVRVCVYMWAGVIKFPSSFSTSGTLLFTEKLMWFITNSIYKPMFLASKGAKALFETRESVSGIHKLFRGLHLSVFPERNGKSLCLSIAWWSTAFLEWIDMTVHANYLC